MQWYRGHVRRTALLRHHGGDNGDGKAQVTRSSDSPSSRAAARMERKGCSSCVWLTRRAPPRASPGTRRRSRPNIENTPTYRKPPQAEGATGWLGHSHSVAGGRRQRHQGTPSRSRARPPARGDACAVDAAHGRRHHRADQQRIRRLQAEQAVALLPSHTMKPSTRVLPTNGAGPEPRRARWCTTPRYNGRCHQRAAAP